MLHNLGWQSLDGRRQDQRLVLFYKIINGLASVETEDMLLLFAPNVKGEWVDSNFQIIDLLVPPRAAGVAGTIIFVHIANFATLLPWLHVGSYCQQHVGWSCSGVGCETCNVWYHRECISITLTHSHYLALNNSAHVWICFKCQTPNFSNSSISITGSPEINFNSPNSFAVLSDLTGKDDVFLRSPLATLFNPPLFSTPTGDTSSFSNFRYTLSSSGMSNSTSSSISNSQIKKSQSWRTLVININSAPGVSILIKKDLNIHIKKSVTSNDGRIMLLIFEFLEETYSICNIYAPIQSTVKDIFFLRAAEFLNVNIPLNSKVIMCGDMNIKLDIKPGISQSNKKEIILLNTLTAKYNLKDIFRARDKHSPGYTYQHSNNNIQSRIDYIFMDPALMNEISNFRIKNSPAPNHKALQVTLTKSLNRRGPSYWKLNTSVLVKPEYVQIMTKLLDTELARCMQNRYTLGRYCQFWDLLKVKIKEHSILYCKKRNIYKKNQILYLEEQIDKIDEQIASKKYHDNILNLKKMESKSEIEIELRLQAKASQIRSKAQYVEEGEKNTAYFLSLEKQRQISNTIYEIQTSDGILVKSNENIMSHIKMFYTDLYSTRHTEYVDYSFIDSLDTPRLKDGDQDICEGLITLMECDLASQKMKLDKSPGLDGIPIEFYHTFRHILGSFLIKIYNESFQLEKLCNSQRTSVLSLLHKKGDVNLLKNYRPISLTNVDYRILGQVLANRLHKVLPTLISHDQAGYVKGRYIGNNIRAIEDLILYAEKENVNSIICFLDFQKAFDSVEWECIYRVLKKFNIGNDYIQWIKTLYYKPKITIKNNGWLTDYIELQRSVRQGCSVCIVIYISHGNTSNQN